jgi:lysophospholipase L1-like esterase
MTKTSLITIASLAGIVLGFATCTLIRKTTKRPEGEVEKVAYADKILLHQHPEKVLNYLPNLKDEQIAYLYGMPVHEYKSVKIEYEEQAKKAAIELLKSPLFAQKVAKLPFKKGETVLVLGESTADALNSWVVILKYLLEIKRPQDKIRIMNAAISGQTTTEALRRITTQVKQSPEWVLSHLGANDCMRYGSEKNKPTVSLPETISNLETIRKIVADETKAQFIWLAPAPVNEEKIASFPPFKSLKMYLKNVDLLKVGDGLRSQQDMVIDMRKDFGVPAKGEYVQFDGGHLSIEGQTVIVKAILNNLSK